jgi:hypothetical protein
MPGSQISVTSRAASCSCAGHINIDTALRHLVRYNHPLALVEIT